MVKPGILAGLILLLSIQVSAQGTDTLQLREIEVYGTPIRQYSSGAKVVKLQNADAGTLNQLVGDQLPVYFKTYGNGQLSTVALRGTSASHTAVLWNGIPVNSPTLGQTDFSLWPAFLIDDIAIQLGSSASLYGSGAIGGSIILASGKPTLQGKPIETSLMSQIGSFGQWTNGIHAAYAKGNLQGRTKVLDHYLENDFSYPVKGLPDVIKKQQHASVRQIGVTQDLYFDAPKQQWSFHSQLLKNDRDVQPSVSNDQGGDTLEDVNLRLSLSRHGAVGSGELNSTLAYQISDQYFNDSSRVVSQQYSSVVNYEQPLGNTSTLRVGTNINYYAAETASYFETDTQADLFAAFHFQPLPNWSLSLNLRQSISRAAKPFAPSIGSEYRLVNTKKEVLFWKAQVSRAYRLPTLNDRFWQPGGNSNLNAEQSWNVETGWHWSLQRNRLNVMLEATIFRNWIDEWILWLPNNDLIWSPANIRKVNITGLELHAEVNGKFADHQWKLSGNYSYTASINESGLSPTDASVGKQLPYVPKHQFSLGLHWKYSAWHVNINNAYTGARFTTDDNTTFNQVDAFNTVNMRIGRTLTLQAMKLEVSLASRNVTNVYYENLINRAMPGRSFLLFFLFTI